MLYLLYFFFYRNVFQDILHKDTLVKAFLDQVMVHLSCEMETPDNVRIPESH